MGDLKILSPYPRKRCIVFEIFVVLTIVQRVTIGRAESCNKRNRGMEKKKFSSVSESNKDPRHRVGSGVQLVIKA